MGLLSAEISRARAELAPVLPRTPFIRADALSTSGGVVYLKNETILPTGSFKVRGALYSLKTTMAGGRISEVVAASTGNHGAAVAYAARALGVRARIFVPDRSNPVKTARILDLGAVLVEAGRDLSAAIDAAQSYVATNGAFFLHDASDPYVPIGTATIGAELLDEIAADDSPNVYVPMGDTALIRGVASALKLAGRAVRVIGVVSERAPAYLLSWKSGGVIETVTADTIADGLAVRRPLAANVAAIRELVDEVVAVSETEMLDAIVRVRDTTSIVAEPSGAAATAAMLRESRPGISVALVTGGNISPDTERQINQRRA